MITYTTHSRISLNPKSRGDDPYIMSRGIVIDANADGLDDLLVIGNYRSLDDTVPIPVKLLVSNGKTMVDRTADMLSGKTETIWVRDYYVADFNGDGRDDIFLSDTGTEAERPFPGFQNQLLLSRPGGGFDNVTATHLPQRNDFSHGGGAGDFDGDGDIDLFINVVGGGDTRYGYIMANDGKGHFEEVARWGWPDDWVDNNILPPELAEAFGTYRMHIFDMNGDGWPDVWTSGMDAGEINSHNGDLYNGWINDGSGHLRFVKDIGKFSQVYDIEKVKVEELFDVDIDRDGDLDLITYTAVDAKNPDVFQIQINDGTGNFVDEGEKRLPSSAFTGRQGIFGTKVLDIDGDGDDDIIKYMFDKDWRAKLNIYTNDGSGHFTETKTKIFPDFRPGAAFLDINGDGIADIVSDMTWTDAWNADHNQKFYSYLAKLDVAVKRTGWATDDAIAGGSKNDVLRGLAGTDVLRGNGGNDLLEGGAGSDRLFGGKGSDTASYANAKSGVTVSLAKASSNTGDAARDKFSSIENLAGSKFVDTLIGNASSNELKGGNGNDKLVGAVGADDLWGGAGKDTFVFQRAKDSTFKTTGQDTIYDFAKGDRFDLSAIDANTKIKGDQAFSFIGTAEFHGKAGELRFEKQKSDTYVYVDINGDKKVDFAFHLDDAVKLVKADFLL